MRLRPARSLDAGKLGAMMTDAVPDWKPRLHSAAEDIGNVGQMIDRGWVTVAEDGALLGFIAREGGYVHALFIADAAQRRGVGRALLRDAQRAVSRLELWAFEANAPACRLYESAGFAAIDRGDGTLSDEGLPEIHFRWERSPAQQQERRA